LPAPKWRRSRDPLYRGDHPGTVTVPTPNADGSLVRHVLYLESFGRPTPYLSTSQSREAAIHFAQPGGLWRTAVPVANKAGVGHVGNDELLGLLRGRGKGDAAWNDPFEVMRARMLVELHGEHLLDFRGVADPSAVVATIFVKP
jgi:hypothetical protein